MAKPGSANSHGPGCAPRSRHRVGELRRHPPCDDVEQRQAEIKRDLAEPARDRQQHRRQRRIDEVEIGVRDRRDRGPCPAAPAARPRTRADSPWSCRCPRFPGPERRPSARCSRPETGYRAALAATEISARARFRKSEGDHAATNIIAAAIRRARRAPARGRPSRRANRRRICRDRRPLRRPPCW